MAHRNCACGLLLSRSSFSRSAAGFFSMRSTIGSALPPPATYSPFAGSSRRMSLPTFL
jgi:hypothetical protein